MEARKAHFKSLRHVIGGTNIEENRENLLDDDDENRDPRNAT